LLLVVGAVQEQALLLLVMVVMVVVVDKLGLQSAPQVLGDFLVINRPVLDKMGLQNTLQTTVVGAVVEADIEVEKQAVMVYQEQVGVAVLV
jgi:hypothetical protein